MSVDSIVKFLLHLFKINTTKKRASFKLIVIISKINLLYSKVESQKQVEYVYIILLQSP